MPVRNASAVWNGTLREGNGTMRMGSGAWEGRYSFGSRFEEATGTNPEELIAAAHAGCYSMALSGLLGGAGHDPQSVETTARVTVEKQGNGFRITRIDLDTTAAVPGLDDAGFQKMANDAKEGCPVSQLVKGGTEITLKAKLKK